LHGAKGAKGTKHRNAVKEFQDKAHCRHLAALVARKNIEKMKNEAAPLSNVRKKRQLHLANFGENRKRREVVEGSGKRRSSHWK
jgi:hypothetical protein